MKRHRVNESSSGSSHISVPMGQRSFTAGGRRCRPETLQEVKAEGIDLEQIKGNFSRKRECLLVTPTPAVPTLRRKEGTLSCTASAFRQPSRQVNS